MTRRRFARREDLGLTPAEFAVLRRLRTPRKIQAFLYGLKQNFELRRRDLQLGAHGAARPPRALHRGRDARRLRAVDPRRAAAAARPAGGARLRPRGGAVPPPRPLGRDLQDQRHRPALARPGVPRRCASWRCPTCTSTTTSATARPCAPTPCPTTCGAWSRRTGSPPRTAPGTWSTTSKRRATTS